MMCAAVSCPVKPEIIVFRVLGSGSFSEHFIHLYVLMSHTQAPKEGLDGSQMQNQHYTDEDMMTIVDNSHSWKTHPAPSFD